MGFKIHRYAVEWRSQNHRFLGSKRTPKKGGPGPPFWGGISGTRPGPRGGSGAPRKTPGKFRGQNLGVRVKVANNICPDWESY